MLISFLHSLPRSVLLFPLSLSLAATSPYGVCNSCLTDRMHFSRAPSALYNYIYECAHQIEWLTHLHNATWLSLLPSPIPPRHLHHIDASTALRFPTGNSCLQFQIANGNLKKRAAAEGYAYKWARVGGVAR